MSMNGSEKLQLISAETKSASAGYVNPQTVFLSTRRVPCFETRDIER